MIKVDKDMKNELQKTVREKKKNETKDVTKCEMPKRIDSNLKLSIGVPENNEVVTKPLTPATKKTENN